MKRERFRKFIAMLLVTLTVFGAVAPGVFADAESEENLSVYEDREASEYSFPANGDDIPDEKADSAEEPFTEPSPEPSAELSEEPSAELSTELSTSMEPQEDAVQTENTVEPENIVQPENPSDCCQKDRDRY